jgi:hypothetical protein
MAHENTRNAMRPANIAQASQVVAAIFVDQSLQRLRGNS